MYILAASRQGSWLRVLSEDRESGAGQGVRTWPKCIAGFLLHINSHRRCLCLNYPELFNGVSVSDEVVTYGSEKLLFTGFMDQD